MCFIREFSFNRAHISAVLAHNQHELLDGPGLWVSDLGETKSYMRVGASLYGKCATVSL